MQLLVVIDMLNDFIQEKGALYCGPQSADISPYVLNLTQKYVQKKQPIIFIMDEHQPDDIEFNRFPVHCVQDTKGAALITELADIVAKKQEVYYVAKSRYSGFYKTNLDALLQQIHPREIHVVGVCTNICVLYTVEELCNRDYNVFVHRGGVASFDEQAHRWALEQMEKVLGVNMV